jgi:hypothetical protein
MTPDEYDDADTGVLSLSLDDENDVAPPLPVDPALPSCRQLDGPCELATEKLLEVPEECPVREGWQSDAPCNTPDLREVLNDPHPCGMLKAIAVRRERYGKPPFDARWQRQQQIAKHHAATVPQIDAIACERSNAPSTAPDHVAQMEVPPRSVDVFGDLGAEVVNARELDLGAEALEEGDLDFAVGLERDGVEVEQVGLDGEGFVFESGAQADVGHRFEDSSKFRVPSPSIASEF